MKEEEGIGGSGGLLVFVEEFGSEKIDIEVEPNGTVGDILKEYETRKKIQPGIGELHFQGETLDNNVSLADSGISMESTLVYSPLPKITIKDNVRKKNYTVRPRIDTVDSILSRFKVDMRLEDSDGALRYDDKQLLNSKTFYENDIVKDSTLTYERGFPVIIVDANTGNEGMVIATFIGTIGDLRRGFEEQMEYRDNSGSIINPQGNRISDDERLKDVDFTVSPHVHIYYRSY